MVLHTPYAEHHEAMTEPAQLHSHTVTVPALTACGAAALVLLIFDMLVPAAMVPPEIRGLALVVILSAAVGAATMWIDRRNEARHQELLAARRPGDCCAVAWVEGLARRPFPGAAHLPIPRG